MAEKKYIFITGGVLSSLGKGVAAASLGNILESYGFRITFIKLDPYLNIDPGTMSPFQHGEVFVTDDGAETDLDLGHYERFSSALTSQKSNWTAGRIYDLILQRERKGDFLGKTVQVIPHVTDAIKSAVFSCDADAEIIICEIGGTVGDIESLPFLEAIRQIGLELDRSNTLYIHLTLVPFIKTAGEQKTKPTQHSVKELREIGIQPDILLCRSEIPLSPESKKKIALFTNLREDSIISATDADLIYEIPLMFKEEGLGDILLQKLNLRPRKNDMKSWESMIFRTKKINRDVTIAIVGKYVKHNDSYKSLYEALFHGGIHNDVRVNLKLIESDTLLDLNASDAFSGADGVLVPGGFGIRGIEGMLKGIEYTRTNAIPFFGICLGMQLAVIEFLRNVCGIVNAHSQEFNPSSEHKAFLKLKELMNVEELGHNMRLGAFKCILKKDTKSFSIYKKELISERHRHRYEFNPAYEETIKSNGLEISGKNPERNLVEIVELSSHPWFIGCQFHPEFQSRPLQPHPLFVSFIGAAKDFHLSR
jgi:CTP synthase